MIRELAENANTYTRLGPDNERIIDPRYVIWLGKGSDDPHWCVVQRLRLEGNAVEETVQEIRALLADRGRRSCTWEVADSATPDNLVELLLELGCVPGTEPLQVGMVLTAPPDDDTPEVTARRVETIDEYAAAIRIAFEAFGAPPAALEERLSRVTDDFEREGAGQATYLAFLDDEPAASGVASFTDHGTILFGGATREDARGRGAYRALVRARWDDAVARGTPVLVTHAGAMSRPILGRLGFREVSHIHALLDEFGTSG